MKNSNVFEALWRVFSGNEENKKTIAELENIEGNSDLVKKLIKDRKKAEERAINGFKENLIKQAKSNTNKTKDINRDKRNKEKNNVKEMTIDGE